MLCKETSKRQKCTFSKLTSTGAGNLTVPALVRAALGAVAICDRPAAGCTVLAVLWRLGARDIVLLCSQSLALHEAVHQGNIVLLSLQHLLLNGPPVLTKMSYRAHTGY